MMYSHRTKKNLHLERRQEPKGGYSRKPPPAKQPTNRQGKNKDRFALEEELLNESSYQANPKHSENIQFRRSTSRQKLFIPSPIPQKRSEEEIKSISIDGIEDLSIIKSRQQLQQNVVNGLKHSVLICDQEGSDEDMPLFTLDISNEEMNYSMLQHEYEKLIKKSDGEESESCGRVLNISTTSLEKSKDDQPNRSVRKEVMMERFEEILKGLHRVRSMMKAEPNSSINLSRESKKILNNNLFEINEEWEHSQIMNKEEKKLLAKDNSNLIEFTLNEINKGELDEHSLKKEVLIEEMFELQQPNQRVEEEKKVRAADAIKNFWLVYRTVKKNSHCDRYEHYRRIMYETNHIEEEKVQEYFPVNDGRKGSKPEDKDNFNQLLSQLSNQSDHETALAELFEEKAIDITKKISELSLEEKKKLPGELIVLENMGSISAIKSGQKLRHLSEQQDDGEEEDDEVEVDHSSNHIIHKNSDGVVTVNQVLEKRVAWIEDCVHKGHKDQTWRLRELHLLQLLKAISLNPAVELDHQQSFFPEELNDSATMKQA